VRAGEIVGLAGLEGSGRTELARALFGADPFERGVVEIDGRAVRIRTPRRAIASGLGFITEDRKGEGLVLGRSVLANATLAVRSLPRRRRPVKGNLREAAAALTERLELRGAGLDGEVQYLSGGNQQKVVLAKWLATEAKVLIFDEPTRGIDVGAKAGIHELVRELADSGVAVLLISSELPEVIGMSDRILVMRQGTVAGELPADSSEEEIMLVATGEAAMAVPA
jgi:ABC-type sugar transport system ATPase subunit